MVKPPKSRHSGTQRDPVTIDLAPGEVSRVKAESEKAGAGSRPEQSGAVSDTKATAAPSNAGAAASTSAEKGSIKSGTEAAASSAASASKPSDPASSSPMSGAKDPARASSSPTGPTLEKKDEAAGEADKAKAGAAAPSRPSGSATGTFGASAAASTAGKGAQTPPPPRSGRGVALAAGVAGGVIALALAAGLQMAGLFPANQPAIVDGSDTEIETLRGEIAQLRQSLDAQTGADDGNGIEALNSDVGALRTEIESVRSQIAEAGQSDDMGAVGERLAALEFTVAALDPADLPDNAALDRLTERVTALAQELGSAREAADAAGQRISALEGEVAELSTQVEEQAGSADTALVIAASALRSAIERGASFNTELDTYAALAPQAEGLDTLRAHAQAGVATQAQLETQMQEAAVAMIGAGRTVNPDAGLLDRLMDSAQGLVTVRPIGAVDGEGVPAIVARMEAALGEGDYARVLAEYETLPAASQAAASDFAERVRARHETDEAATRVLDAALRA